MIAGVIFDLGSTLIHFEGDWDAVLDQGLEALTRQLAAVRVDVDGPAFRQAFRRQMDATRRLRVQDHVERTTESIVREALAAIEHPPLNRQQMEAALRALYAPGEALWRPMPGLHPTLEALRNQGYRLGLISNAGDEANVRRLLAAAALDGIFSPELISAAEGVRKPNVTLFQRVLSAWDLPPESVVMVGDTLGEDILGAQRAGVRSIWFTADADTPANRALIGQVRPEAVTDVLPALPDLIRSLDGVAP